MLMLEILSYELFMKCIKSYYSQLENLQHSKPSRIITLYLDYETGASHCNNYLYQSSLGSDIMQPGRNLQMFWCICLHFCVKDYMFLHDCALNQGQLSQKGARRKCMFFSHKSYSQHYWGNHCTSMSTCMVLENQSITA